MTAGRLITFEGGEGCGKSTQIKRLASALDLRGERFLVTREPGGSPGAEDIRRLLVEGEPGRWDAITEALLVSAARRDHVERVIRPALAEGRWVLCDRFHDSTTAYQGAGHGVDADTLEELRRIALGDLRPDLTLLLDLDIDIGLGRAQGRGGKETRFERFDRAFHQRVRDGFLTIARTEPGRVRLIDASDTPEAVAAAILALVDSCFTV